MPLPSPVGVNGCRKGEVQWVFLLVGVGKGIRPVKVCIKIPCFKGTMAITKLPPEKMTVRMCVFKKHQYKC